MWLYFLLEMETSWGTKDPQCGMKNCLICHLSELPVGITGMPHDNMPDACKSIYHLPPEQNSTKMGAGNQLPQQPAHEPMSTFFAGSEKSWLPRYSDTKAVAFQYSTQWLWSGNGAFQGLTHKSCKAVSSPQPCFFLFIAAIFHITGENLPHVVTVTYQTNGNLMNINCIRARSRTSTIFNIELTIMPWCLSLWRDIKAATDPKYLLWCIQTTYCGQHQKHLGSRSATIQDKQIQYHLGMAAGYVHV